MSFNLNPKYKTTVEDIVISGNEGVNDRTIRKSLTFHVGDIFQRSEMLRSQRALYESNLFRRAAIEPRPPIDIATPDSAKVIVVTVQEAPPREARLSAGFNTIDFFQVEGRYTHYNFMGAGPPAGHSGCGWKPARELAQRAGHFPQCFGGADKQSGAVLRSHLQREHRFA